MHFNHSHERSFKMYVRKSFTCDPELARQMKKYLKGNAESESKFIERAVREFCEKLSKLESEIAK